MGLGSNPWETFAETMRQSDELFDVATVTVYNYSGGYDETTGETDWTRGPGTDIRAQVAIAQPSVTSDASGLQTEDGDADMLVRDDVESHYGITLYPIGTKDQKATEVEYQDRTFLIADVIDQRNGLKLIPMVEADR